MYESERCNKDTVHSADKNRGMGERKDGAGVSVETKAQDMAVSEIWDK